MAYVKRIIIYIIGMLLLATGIILTTKTSFGTSPLVSVAFCVATLADLKFANCALVLYLIFFVIEAILKGKDFHAIDLLQIVFCYVFTRCMNVLTILLPDPQNIPLRIVLLIIAVICTGFGGAIMIAAKLVPNPADGLVHVLSQRIHKPLGLTKNLFDLTCVVIAIVIGLAATRRLVGVGIGTIVSVLGTGRAVALCNHLFLTRITKVVEAAPLRVFGEKKA